MEALVPILLVAACCGLPLLVMIGMSLSKKSSKREDGVVTQPRPGDRRDSTQW